MSEAQLRQLFTPFMQGDGSLNRKYEGSGLGLVVRHSEVAQIVVGLSMGRAQ